MRPTVLFLSMLCATVAPARAAAVDTAGATVCKLHGFLAATDPAGIDVRAAPRTDAPVIGHLPPRAHLPDDQLDVSTVFLVVGSRDGWLLVRNATALDNDANVIFAGPGWIPGAATGFAIGSSELRIGPGDSAPISRRLIGTLDNGANFGPTSFRVLDVYSCEDHFVDVTVALPPNISPNAQPMRGWVATVCSNPFTSCDPLDTSDPWRR